MTPRRTPHRPLDVHMLDAGSRGGVDTVRRAADRAAAPAQAINEIRELLDSVCAGAMVPSRKIRQILKRHSL